ncbi:MAG TPA: N-acetylmuramoyl-L-alanine amidase, partial [Terriglobales bacterium]|nr:N-acetylmuramoyl-L-alanine amidase [Terriglobales bacterium]
MEAEVFRKPNSLTDASAAPLSLPPGGTAPIEGRLNSPVIPPADSHLTGNLDQLSSRIQRWVRCSGVAIAVAREGKVVCAASSGAAAPPVGTHVDPHRGLSAECLRLRATRVCNDAANDPKVNREVCRRSGIRSIVVVPLVYEGSAVGILAVFSGQPGYFTEAHVFLLEFIASFVTRSSMPSNPPVVAAAVARRPETVAITAAMDGHGAGNSDVALPGAPDPPDYPPNSPPENSQEVPISFSSGSGSFESGSSGSGSSGSGSSESKSWFPAGSRGWLRFVIPAAGAAYLLAGFGFGAWGPGLARRAAPQLASNSAPRVILPPAGITTPEEKTPPSDPPRAVLGETGFVGDSVEHSTLPGYTRIAIRLDRERKVECRRLISPARLYCDIDGVRISTAGPVEHFTGDALLEAMRVGALRPDQARIVFDLKSASVRHVVAVVPNPPRLLVEIVNLSTLGIRSSEPRDTPVEAVPGNQKRIRQEAAPQQPPAQITRAFSGKNAGGTESADRQSESDFLKPGLLKPGLLKEERIVVIDPGHGGHDNGSIGPGGLHEKDLVLDVARRLGELLRTQPGVRVIFTRTTDEFLALEERSAIANRAHAGIFVSIHGNASPYAPAEGIETYYLGNSDASRDLVVADRENRRQPRSLTTALAVESHSGSEVLLVQQQGKQLAEDVQRALHTAAAEAGDIRNRGVRM